jgi:glutamate racemase
MKHYYKHLLVGTMLSGWGLSACSAASALSLQLVRESIDILIMHDVCDRATRCKSEERVLRAGTEQTVRLYIYKAVDLSEAAIGDIVRLYAETYEYHNKKKTIIAKFYKEPHRTGLFKQPTPYISILFQGEK